MTKFPLGHAKSLIISRSFSLFFFFLFFPCSAFYICHGSVIKFVTCIASIYVTTYMTVLARA